MPFNCPIPNASQDNAALVDTFNIFANLREIPFLLFRVSTCSLLPEALCSAVLKLLETDLLLAPQ